MSANKDLEGLDLVTMDGNGVQLTNLRDAETFCRLYHQSGLAPASLNTPDKIFVALQTGAEAGLRPSQALRALYVVGNTPAWKGDAALGLIQSKGVLDGAYTLGNEGTGEDRVGFFEFRRKGWTQAQRVTFSAREACKAGLKDKGPGWKFYPDDMLVWRAVSRAGKRYFSDVLLGLDIAEVVREYAEELPEARRTPPAEADPLLSGIDEPATPETAAPDPEPDAALYRESAVEKIIQGGGRYGVLTVSGERYGTSDKGIVDHIRPFVGTGELVRVGYQVVDGRNELLSAEVVGGPDA